MSGEREVDEPTGVETTGHDWDGIRELDNPLPRWWLWIFYASIVWAIVYWVLMPAWPGVSGYTRGIRGQSDRSDVSRELSALKTVRGVQAARLQNASLEDIERDPNLQSVAFWVGQSVFGDNCATCHGVGGTGSKGYANLRDDVWLWGGSLDEIKHTITVGVRSSAPDTRNTKMPAFGRDEMLSGRQVNDLTEYVVALSGRQADDAALARVRQTFADQCASCHGADGKGNQAKGAPNLTDREWLYGSDRQAIYEQIWNGRGGVMPTWGTRFDEPTLKALAVYIHANAAGQ
jgi:cytochrome c oxidase cbb3-type subunit III